MAYRVGDSDSGGRVDSGDSSDRLNRMVAGAFGAVYLLVGLLGFFGHKSGEEFAGRDGHSLFGFQVNNLHNIVHLAIGAALLAAAAAGWKAARSANLTVGVVYLALGILGFFIQKTAINIVALNVNDHFLHLVSGALLTAVALSGRKRTAVDRV